MRGGRRREGEREAGTHAAPSEVARVLRQVCREVRARRGRPDRAIWRKFMGAMRCGDVPGVETAPESMLALALSMSAPV